MFVCVGLGGPRVAVGGVLVSCNHCRVVGKRGRLLAGGSFSGSGVVNGGGAWVLPGR